ncbi:MAG: hypothetical protein WDN08_10195 [Rhizomicrobium sp.]
MSELVFDVTQDGDGGFVAEALGEGIVTEADTWEELRDNVREAVAAYFFDRTPPQRVRLHWCATKFWRETATRYQRRKSR